MLRGHYGYYGVIFNSRSLHAFYEGVKRSWFKALQRRSQKSRMNWQRFDQLLAVYPLPKPVIHQPLAQRRGKTTGHLPEEPGAVTPHAGICGGESQQWLIYPTNPHATFCRSRRRVTASGDPVVLRAAARVIISGRRVTMIIGEAFAKSWQRLWPWLECLRYADP